jgi:hypothetical protein
VLIPGYALASAEHGRGYVAKLRSMPSFVEGWIKDRRWRGGGTGRTLAESRLRSLRMTLCWTAISPTIRSRLRNPQRVVSR